MFRRNFIAIVGILATFAYLSFLIFVLFSQWSEFSNLKPNEWGDFIAGGLGPLAIFWLILSFFQQSRELQHSVDALKLQAEELKNSVEQQKELVRVSRDTLDHERFVISHRAREDYAKLQPNFIVANNGGISIPGGFRHKLSITNAGGNVSNVEGAFDPSHPIGGGQFNMSLWPKGSVRVVEFQFPEELGAPVSTVLSISFTDEEGIHSSHQLKFLKHPSLGLQFEYIKH